MSTQLRSENGTRYPVSQVFVGGVLDESALQKYGIPKLTGSFAYSMFMANAAVCIQPQIHFDYLRLISFFLSFLDWCFDRSLFPLLGRRRQKGVPEREEWSI